MTNCLYCGKPLENKRKDAKYCDGKHRTYYGRRQRAAEKKIHEFELLLQANAKAEAIASHMPKTAKLLRSFVAANGVECSNAAVSLVLEACKEVLAMRQPRKC